MLVAQHADEQASYKACVSYTADPSLFIEPRAPAPAYLADEMPASDSS